MARLIDDLRASNHIVMPHFIAPWNQARWDAYARRVMELFRNDLPVILIDNVSKYYYESNDQEFWSLDKDFPNIAPPYPQFWMEHRLPRQIVSRTEGVTDVTQWAPNGRVGMLFTCCDPATSTYSDGEPPAGTKWIVWMELFVDYGSAAAGFQGPHGPTFICVDAEGRLLGVPWMQSYAEPGLEKLMKSIMSWFHPGFLAISFLHCKNVKLEDHKVDAPLAKKWRAKHGFSPTPYHTLVIEPLKAVLRKEGRADEHGLAKALHICRGHFRDYTEGRGLFGKLHGRYWMPSTVRGTKGEKAPPREVEIRV